MRDLVDVVWGIFVGKLRGSYKRRGRLTGNVAGIWDERGSVFKATASQQGSGIEFWEITGGLGIVINAMLSIL